jgi:hypothetical protein
MEYCCCLFDKGDIGPGFGGGRGHRAMIPPDAFRLALGNKITSFDILV